MPVYTIYNVARKLCGKLYCSCVSITSLLADVIVGFDESAYAVNESGVVTVCVVFDGGQASNLTVEVRSSVINSSAEGEYICSFKLHKCKCKGR